MSTRAFRTITLATALVLAALIPALYFFAPAQAQNVVRDDIVRITDVFSGTQSASVVIVLEYSTPTFNGAMRIVEYPNLFVRLCDDCGWTRTESPTKPTKEGLRTRHSNKGQC